MLEFVLYLGTIQKHQIEWQVMVLAQPQLFTLQ